MDSYWTAELRLLEGIKFFDLQAPPKPIEQELVFKPGTRSREETRSESAPVFTTWGLDLGIDQVYNEEVLCLHTAVSMAFMNLSALRCLPRAEVATKKDIKAKFDVIICEAPSVAIAQGVWLGAPSILAGHGFSGAGYEICVPREGG